MSLLITKIPTDLAAVKAKLPTGSFIHGVVWNPTSAELELTWEHEQLVTKHTFPYPFPLASLDGELPSGVVAKTAAPKIEAPKPVDTKAKNVRKPKA